MLLTNSNSSIWLVLWLLERKCNDVNKGGDGNLISLLAFYLGRLSARDDTKAWSKIALGRVAELQEKALDDSLLKSCISFYLAKMQ